MRALVDRGEMLWRRVHPDHYLGGRITSAAFKHHEMSVDVARVREDMRLTLNDGTTRKPAVGVLSLNSTVAYDNGLTVEADPIEGNEAHALVVGRKSPPVITALKAALQFVPRSEIEAAAGRFVP